MNFDIKRIVVYRQFCNKLWNAVRFALVYIDQFKPTPDMCKKLHTLPGIRTRDLAVLSSLNNTIKTCNIQMQAYTFGNVANALYAFFLYDVCDVYLELIKPVINIKNQSEADEDALNQQFAAQSVLYTCLEQFLRLCHPLMPFVTEELWQRLPNRTELTAVASIMIASYPEEVKEWDNTQAVDDATVLKDCIHAARSLRVDYKIPNHVKADFYYRTESNAMLTALKSQEQDFCTLAKGNIFTYLDVNTPNPNKNLCVKVINDSLSLLVDLTGLIDIDQEINRLNKEKDRLEPVIDQYKRKIAAPGYSTKVPEAVQAVNTEKLASAEAELIATLAAIDNFEKMKL